MIKGITEATVIIKEWLKVNEEYGRKVKAVCPNYIGGNGYIPLHLNDLTDDDINKLGLVKADTDDSEYDHYRRVINGVEVVYLKRRATADGIL